MSEHAGPGGDGDGNEGPAENGVDATPEVGKNVLFPGFPDFGVVKLNHGEVDIHAVPEGAVFARGLL